MNDLRAKFELDFQVGSLSPLESVQNILGRIEQVLGDLRRTTDPFSDLLEPVARATSGVTSLNRALEETRSATGAAATGVSELDKSLSSTGGLAAEAGKSFQTMGEEAQAGVMQAVGAMNRLHESWSGNLARSGLGSGTPNTLMGAAGHFRDSVNSGIGDAFGAAAAGFGLIAPVRAAAEYDNALTHIGITLGVEGNANKILAQRLGQQINDLARRTGQKSGDLVNAETFLSQEGYNLPQLQAFMPTVARISTAYNADPEAVAKTAFALNQNLGVSSGQLPTALAMIARVGKESALPMEQLAPLFPAVAAQAAHLGVSGMQGVADIGAMMALIRKNVGSEGSATADFRAFMQTLTTQHGRMRFGKFLGLDVEKFMNAEKYQGHDPVMAVMGMIANIKDSDRRNHVINELFANEMDQSAVAAMSRQWGQLNVIRDRISGTSPKMIQQDFDTGSQSTLIRLHLFEDALTQMERRVGTSFVPTINAGTVALNGLSDVFDWLDKHIPGSTSVITGSVGAVLALTTVLGALGAVTKPVVAGWRLMRAAFSAIKVVRLIASLGGLVVAMGPVGWVALGVVAALGAIALVYTKWDSLKAYFGGFGTWMSGWAKTISSFVSDQFSHMFDGLKSVWEGLERVFANSPMALLFQHDWTPRLQGAHAGVSAAGHAPQRIDLHVSHDPGLRVHQTNGTKGTVSTRPDAGRMVSRP
ncbi:MAG: phage tail tape measure protein [Acetobacter sp.]|nr:phage tail tape measure protein [Acetobacter sp.]